MPDRARRKDQQAATVNRDVVLPGQIFIPVADLGVRDAVDLDTDTECWPSLSRKYRPSLRRRTRWRSGAGRRRARRSRSNSRSGNDSIPPPASRIDSTMSARWLHLPRRLSASVNWSGLVRRCCTAATMTRARRADTFSLAASMMLRGNLVRGGTACRLTSCGPSLVDHRTRTFQSGGRASCPCTGLHDPPGITSVRPSGPKPRRPSTTAADRPCNSGPGGAASRAIHIFCSLDSGPLA